MLYLNIEAESYDELLAKVRSALYTSVQGAPERAAVVPAVDMLPPATDPLPTYGTPPTAITLPSAPEKQSRRGRPPKNKAVGDVAVESAPAVSEEKPQISDAPAEAATGPKVEAAATAAGPESNGSSAADNKPATTAAAVADAPTDTAAVVTTAQPASEPVVSASTHSIDDCRVALQAVNERHGLPGCMALLKEFGVDRVSLVAPEKFAEFIAACQAKAAA